MNPVNFKDLQRLSHGFQSAKVFLCAVELDLFTHLKEGATALQVAERLHLQERPLLVVLNALVAMGLLRYEQGRYTNAPVAQDNLVAGEGYRGHIFRHIHHCWPAWSSLAEVLAGKEQAPERDALGQDDIKTRDFILGMENVTRELAPRVAEKLHLDHPGVLLDVGGGPGTYAEAFLQCYPSLREVRIFDLPGAIDVGQKNLADCARPASLRWIKGDFNRDPLGEGADVVWMSQVLHSLDPSGCRMLIGKAHEALNAGGELIVHEFMVQEDRTGPLQATLFAVHMLVMTGVGRTYSAEEIVSWLTDAGFLDVRVQKISDDTSVVRGRKGPLPSG